MTYDSSSFAGMVRSGSSRFRSRSFVRTSAIAHSPVQRISGRLKHRSISGNLLAIFLLVLLSASLPAADRPLTRLELAEKAATVLQNRFLDEAQAITSGLLHSYPDGRIHLDWPATRGAAAVVLEKLSRERGDPAQPGFFPDIPPDSPLASALAQVGKFFSPEPGDRFRPEKLLTGAELAELLKAYRDALENHLSDAPASYSLRPQMGAFVDGQSFSNDFLFSNPGTEDTAEDVGSGSSMPGQISRLHSMTPADQWSPQGAFNLAEAQDGVS